MDRFSAQAVNMLVGNNIGEPVIELHFPASIFLFECETMIAIGGADFSASINGEDAPLWQPLMVAKNSVLQFQKWKHGARCYLGVREKLDIEKWLNSYSTNVKAMSGGFYGRILQKDDLIHCRQKSDYKHFLKDADFAICNWKADTLWSATPTERIAVLPGNEWSWLTEESQTKLLREPFAIDSMADRMGYRLQGKISAAKSDDLVSSVVSFGTIQLLPNGELIILMADHQTTGGYPRIAHVVSAHLPVLAQMQPGEKINFRLVDQQHAEDLLSAQHYHLLQLQHACKLKLEEFFNATYVYH